MKMLHYNKLIEFFKNRYKNNFDLIDFKSEIDITLTYEENKNILIDKFDNFMYEYDNIDNEFNNFLSSLDEMYNKSFKEFIKELIKLKRNDNLFFKKIYRKCKEKYNFKFSM